MTHPVQFKFLLLLTFAVCMHQCGGIVSQSTPLNDCCIYGRNRSNETCNTTSYNYSLIPKSLKSECQIKIQECCLEQREINDCQAGIKSAQNGTFCSNLSIYYKMCHDACLVGIDAAKRGNDCNTLVKKDENFRFDSRKECCDQKRSELLLHDDDDIDDDPNDEDPEDYANEDNDKFYDPTNSTDNKPATIAETGTETTTTTKKQADYEYDVETADPTTTTTSTEFPTTIITDLPATASVEYQTTTERLPATSRHSTTSEELTTITTQQPTTTTEQQVRTTPIMKTRHRTKTPRYPTTAHRHQTTTPRHTTPKVSIANHPRTPTRHSTIPPFETTTKIRIYQSPKTSLSSLETNEIDTAAAPRKLPPILRNPYPNWQYSSYNQEMTLRSPPKQPSSDRRHPHNYQHSVMSHRPAMPSTQISNPSSRSQEHIRSNDNNTEPCGDLRYCEHDCIFENGLQKCSCNPGYVLQKDGRSCLLADGTRPDDMRMPCEHGKFRNDFGTCQDIDECKIENNGCGTGTKCENTIGSYKCIPSDICSIGFTFNERYRTCDDINECLNFQNTCKDGQKCINTIGSYTCEESYLIRCPEESVTTVAPTTTTQTTTTTTTQRACPDGFQRDYKGNCVDIDECTSNPCSQELICVNKNGGYVCEISHCGKGFKLKGRECIDIDECESNPCPLTHNCINKKGSFTCKHKNCPSGYKLSAFGECEDVNECQDREHLRCSNGYCVNTNGSFYCNCNPGYKKNGRVHCYDIDECAENIHGCSHQCINEFGGYRCSCNNGFRLNSDQRTCDDIDECSENGDLLCRGDCENTYGGYECRCPAGFRNHSSFCVDIDECLDHPGICMQSNEKCLNIVGSYRCLNVECEPDYKLIKRHENKYCHLKTPCGDDDSERECIDQPWLYSNLLSARTANCSASIIFRFTIQARFDVIIRNIQVFSPKATVKKAEFDDFRISKISSGFYLSTVRPIDGPQDIFIDVMTTIYRSDGNVELRKGEKVQLVVSEFPYSSFYLRK